MKKNFLKGDFIDLNRIGEDDVVLLNSSTRKNFFVNLFSPNTDIYGTKISVDDMKRRKKQVIIVCFLMLLTIGSIIGGTIAILEAKKASAKPKTTYYIERKIKNY